MTYNVFGGTLNLAHLCSLAPKITYDRAMRPSFSLMVGSSIYIEVNISGQPRPSVCWFHNDTKIEESNRVSTETAEGWSSLKVKATTADDAGAYKVTAENTAGFDSAEFQVLVKGIFLVHPVIYITVACSLPKFCQFLTR